MWPGLLVAFGLGVVIGMAGLLPLLILGSDSWEAAPPDEIGPLDRPPPRPR